MPTERTPQPASGAYRVVWRWHFYAGLLVLPVLMLMALTGGLYLFQPEIDAARERSAARVVPSTRQVSPELWLAAAQADGGQARTARLSDRRDRAVRFTVDGVDGRARYVFVDPADARVTGQMPVEGPMETIKKLHSLSIAGPVGNWLVEIVAGWAIVLVATGLFLWWPRPREAGVLTIRARRGRPFWRDLHAVVGLYAGGLIAFLAVTGMPWSPVWGEQARAVIAALEIGRPPAPSGTAWRTQPVADDHADHSGHGATGWTLEGATLVQADGTPGRLSTVVAAARDHGVSLPMTIAIPRQADQLYGVSQSAARVQTTRTVYIDPASGRIVDDIGYDRFGPGARAVEWGIAVHQGTQYGQINRWLMLSACIAVWILGISAGVMWWKRRPPGRLAAPAAPPGPRHRIAALAIVLPLGILYPLTGLSLLVAVALDRLIARFRHPAGGPA